MKKPSAKLVLLLVTCGWGSTFIVTKALLRDAPPFLYLAIRFSIATLALLPVVLWRGLGVPRGNWRPFLRDSVVLGLLNAVGLVLQVFGQVYTSPAKSAFITSLNTPLTALFGLIVYRELPTRGQRVGVALASVGLLLLTWPLDGARFNPGDLLTVGCAILYAGFIVESARRTPRHGALSLAFSQIVIATLLFTSFAIVARLLPFTDGELLRLELRPYPRGITAALQMAYMSLVCVAAIMLVQTWALHRLPATTAAVIYSLESVVATALAVIVGGASEWPGPRGATGGFLVLCAIYVAEGRRRRSSSASATTASDGSQADADEASDEPEVSQPDGEGSQK